MFNKLYKTPVINPRIFMVYGPGQKDYSKLVPYVILSLLKNKAPKLTDGSRLVDWIYVDDVVDSLLTGAMNDIDPEKSFHIGSGQHLTVKEIVNKLVEIMDSDIRPAFGVHSSRPFERIVKADQEKILIKPKIGIEEGLKRTVDWYKRNYKKITQSPQYKAIAIGLSFFIDLQPELLSMI